MGTTLKNSPVARWARAKAGEVFGADLRSLATFRIVLAVLVLIDLAARTTNFYAHYTNEGVTPLASLRPEQQARYPWLFSLTQLSGEPFFQALMFGVTALAALALLAGYRTRLANVVLYVLMFAMYWRNPLVNSGADVLLLIMIFWGMFLPLGAYWSVDRARKAVPARLSMRFLSLATVALFMQIAFMYWFTAILKSDPAWRTDGTALYYAMSRDPVTTPIGDYLLQFPTLLEVLTFASFGLEAFGPFLLFCPILTGPVRTGAVLAFMSLHFGILMTMSIGIFPLVSAFCMVCFLPSWFWDKALPKVRAALFSEQSGIARHLRHTAARLARTRRSSLRTRSYATKSVGCPPMTAGIAAHNNIRLGGQTPRASTPPTAPAPSRTGDEPTTMLRSSLATNLLAAFFLFYVFCSNLTSVSEFELAERVEFLPGLPHGLNQSFNMFAPYPGDETYWYVIPGTLRGGQKVDLLAPLIHNDWRLVKEVSLENPDNLDESKYWRKYLTDIENSDETTPYRKHFAKYVCREWNAVHAGSQKLTKFRFVEFEEKTVLPEDHQAPTPRRYTHFTVKCAER